MKTLGLKSFSLTGALLILSSVGKAQDQIKNEKDNYQFYLHEFKNGKNDSVFLRNTLIIAVKLHDIENSIIISNTYFDVIAAPLNSSNISFFVKNIQSEKEKAFKFYSRHIEQISDSILYENITSTLRNTIISEVTDIVNEQIKTDHWTDIESRLVNKYGRIAELPVLSVAALYYFNRLDIGTFVEVKSKIHQNYPQSISVLDMNNDAWTVFENTSDPKLLKVALSWSEKVIAKEHTANYYDTYANILYRSGKREEAINAQKIALTLDAGNGSIDDVKKNLEKMQNGQPTWK